MSKLLSRIWRWLGNSAFGDRFVSWRNQRPDLVQLSNNSIDSREMRHVVTWDQFVSPPTLGDLVEVMMLARWIASQGRTTLFVVVTGEYRQDWSLSDHKIFESSQIEVAKRLALRNGIDVLQMTWDEFETQILNDPNSYVVFRNQVRIRRELYTRSLSLLNRLVAKDKEKRRDQWLLDSSELSTSVLNSSKIFMDGEYVAWGVRNRAVSPERNIGESEFRLLYLALLNRSHGLPIVIVSDRDSCEFFKKVAHKFGFVCLFSADYSESFLDDAAIALGGRIFFQVRGGGMGEVALYSKLPFEMSYTLSPPRKTIRKSQITAWQTSQQIFNELDSQDMSLHLPKFDLQNVL